jgi:hypothetical protein
LRPFSRRYGRWWSPSAFSSRWPRTSAIRPLPLGRGNAERKPPDSVVPDLVTAAGRLSLRHGRTAAHGRSVRTLASRPQRARAGPLRVRPHPLGNEGKDPQRTRRAAAWSKGLLPRPAAWWVIATRSDPCERRRTPAAKRVTTLALREGARSSVARRRVTVVAGPPDLSAAPESPQPAAASAATATIAR